VNLVELAMKRRDAEQLAASWRKPDRDEASVKLPPEPCVICGETFERHRGVKPKAHICQRCCGKGWRSSQCECGAYLRTWDMSKRNGRRCPKCRGGESWDEEKRAAQRRYNAAHRAKRAKSQLTAGLAPALEG
jgi:hypothetical protein